MCPFDQTSYKAKCFKVRDRRKSTRLMLTRPGHLERVPFDEPRITEDMVIIREIPPEEG